MTDLKRIKTKFDNAQRALLSNLFDTEQQSHSAYVQIALDRMRQAFNELLISTFDLMEEMPPQPQEFLCAYAVNMGDDWNESRWQVVFVDGKLVQSPPSVAEFTRKMLAEGWKSVSPPPGSPTTELQAPDGRTVLPLYFCRSAPASQHLSDASLYRIASSLLSSN